MRWSVDRWTLLSLRQKLSMATSRIAGTVQESRHFAKDYIGFRLREECSKDPSFKQQVNGVYDEFCRCLPEPELKYLVLRAAAEAVEKRYDHTFDGMCKKLRIERSTVCATYYTVVKELFRDGVNWGRVCALYSFAGALAVHLVRRGYCDLVPGIPSWVAHYVDQNLSEWIVDHNGWDGLVEHFGAHGPAERDTSIWNRVLAVGSIVAGVAGVAVVAFSLK